LDSHSFHISKEINILDVGCGAGIFSFIFLLKNFYQNLIEIRKDSNENNNYENINLNLYLTDIDQNCILSSYINFINYKELFRNHIIEISKKKYKINLKLIDLSVGDLIKNFTSLNEMFLNYFDYILANLPQTPSQDLIISKLLKIILRR